MPISRRDFLKTGLAAGAYAAVAGMLPSSLLAEEGEYNVLFIAVDDLRPTIGCYGFPAAHTPNMDALAARGPLFNRAYCQQAVCSPSRTSLLTGRRPDTTRIYDLQTHFRLTIPDVVTLPEHFKKNGYHAQGFSKIYHGGLDDPQSWSVPHWGPGGPGYAKPETLEDMRRQAEQFKAEGKQTRDEVLERDPKTGQALRTRRAKYRIKGPAWEDPDVADNVLPDGRTADKAIEALREVKDKRFFLATGFLKPHLPFVAPKKYFDFYPPGKLSPADNPLAPKDCPEIALTTWGELRQYTDIPAQGPVSDAKALELIRAYHAAASYTDAQIGRVLGELDRLGLREKTVVVVWGDHGWHLGDHGLWCKHTNFEETTHSLLIFSAPGQKHKGAKTDALVEFVDVYPTLCDLTGLPIPGGLEGISAKPVMDDPKRPWKSAAFSQYPRGNVMGYTMRTDRYRYTEWFEPGKDPVAVELYDYEKDPSGNVNVAGLTANKELVADLSKRLKTGWKGTLPASR